MIDKKLATVIALERGQSVGWKVRCDSIAFSTAWYIYQIHLLEFFLKNKNWLAKKCPPPQNISLLGLICYQKFFLWISLWGNFSLCFKGNFGKIHKIPSSALLMNSTWKLPVFSCCVSNTDQVFKEHPHIQSHLCVFSYGAYPSCLPKDTLWFSDLRHIWLISGPTTYLLMFFDITDIP